MADPLKPETGGLSRVSTQRLKNSLESTRSLSRFFKTHENQFIPAEPATALRALVHSKKINRAATLSSSFPFNTSIPYTS